jgi:hypothetical protein
MTVDDLINRVSNAIVNPIVLLLFSWAFLMFLWGVFQFVYAADDLKAREDGKRHLLYGIIGIVVMVGAIGIVNIIKATVAQ